LLIENKLQAGLALYNGDQAIIHLQLFIEILKSNQKAKSETVID